MASGLSTVLFAELEERAAEYERLKTDQTTTLAEIEQTQRRIALLRELLDIEGVEVKERTFGSERILGAKPSQGEGWACPERSRRDEGISFHHKSVDRRLAAL